MKREFLLQDLVNELSDEHRKLITRVEDPLGLSQTMAISGARALDLAEETHLVFCKTERPDLLAQLQATKARFVLARPEIMSILPSLFVSKRVLILTPRPRLLLALMLHPFDSPPAVAFQDRPIHPKARIAETAQLGAGVVIGADVELGPKCVIGPNTVIDHATIGASTVIGSNCSIGGDGYGYEIDEESAEIVKFPHFGRVYIGTNVEISDNCCIDRGSLRDTVLEDDVKVDNLVHIAHNCVIKRGAFIIANAMLGGSSTIGEYAWVAPSSSLINGITMGRCAMTGLGAVAVKSIADNEIAVGVPARPLRKRFREGFKLL